jgi:aminopeptidase N
MNTTIKRWLALTIVPLLVASCGLAGIHFKVHNPKKQGKYPKFDRETILLGEYTPIRSSFDAYYYHIDIQFFPDDKKLGGWVEMQARALVDIDSIQIDLDQPLELQQLKWAARQGQSLQYTRDERAVFIALPSTVKAGETFTIHIKYFGKPVIAKKPPWDGGLVWKKDDNKNPWAGVACESEGSSIWFPCKDHTADEPDSVDLSYSINNPNVIIVGNGQYAGKKKTENLQTYNWKVTYPINLYNITFYIGDFVKIEDSYTGINGKHLPISHYVLKPNEEKARTHFKQVKRHIRVYEEAFGEYSWYRDGFRLVESPFAGMEHQAAIAYGNGYKNDLNQTDDYIIVHEAGHEWFGNAITASDLCDVWLQEGITTYGEVIYLERQYGSMAAASHLLFYRWMIANKRPLVGPRGRRYFDYHDGDVYVKGAWTLHSLRNTINNDELFFKIIQTFYEEYKLKVTNSSDFIEVVNRLTGEDYNWFFNQYLYKHKVPFLEFEYTDEGEFYYRWTAVDDDFTRLPILINFPGTNELTTLYPTTKIQLYKPQLNGNLPLEPTVLNNETLFGFKRNKKLVKLLSK